MSALADGDYQSTLDLSSLLGANRSMSLMRVTNQGYYAEPPFRSSWSICLVLAEKKALVQCPSRSA